jgi:DNA ligase-1
VAATASRTQKEEALAAAIAALAPEEVPAGVALLSGTVRQRATGVGWAALRDAPAPAAAPSLTVGELDAAIERVTGTRGAGSAAARAALLTELLGRATAPEQAFLRAALSDGVRQGASRTAVAAAVARAAGVPPRGRPARAHARRRPGRGRPDRPRDGEAGLAAVALEVGRPLEPMLAATAPDLDAALAKVGGEAVVDAKLDGVRVQAHRTAAGEVRAFTRTLDEVTARVPELVEAVAALPGGALVLDGELIALRPDGRPQPFQVTSSRFGTRSPGSEVPLSAFFFDVLHAGGEDLLDRPARERFARLDAIVPAGLRVDRGTDAGAVQERALGAGHEGVVVKALDAPYAAGRRGAGWIKVKPRVTLDLVILAAEWGHGRRTGKLSNLHLGAQADDGDGFVMLGKTFKGLTDKMLAWQTDACSRSRSAGRGGRCTSGPSSSSRSPSTASRPPPATPAGWPCASRGSCATGRTNGPTRRTRSPPSSPPRAD